MKGILQIAINAVSRFGVLSGLRLLMQVKLRQVQALKVPGIPHPIKLRKQGSDIALFNSIIFSGQFSNLKIGANPKVIIDGGANIGLFAIIMKARFPEARIICIEPDPENCALLRENMAHYQNIFIEQKGLWSSASRLKVTDKYDQGKWGMIVEEDQAGAVEAVTVADLVDKYSFDRIDVLKIDIEGSERQVFSGDCTFITRTKMLVVELHDWLEPGCSRPFFEAVNRHIRNYEYGIDGEETVIVNLDF